jgi:hypothetical protein
MADNINELKNSVEHLHECTAEFTEAVEVRESFQGKPVWEGIVQIFKLTGHPYACFCYAWSSPIEGSTKRRFFAVLNAPPVNSPQDAVRAAIVEEYRQNPTKT